MIASKRYLVPIDFSSVSKSALQFAKELAVVQKAELILLHIVGPDDERTKKERQLKDFAKEKLEGFTEYSIKVILGDPSQDIGKLAEAMDIELVVLGTHGALGMRKYFGGYAFKIVEHSTVPMIIVQEETEYHAIKKIAMTIDLEKESIQIVKMAKKLSELFKAEIYLLAAKHTDDFYRHKITTNMMVCAHYLNENHIPFEMELLDNHDFQDQIIRFSEKKHIDLLAATHREGSWHLFKDSFMQGLANNKLHIPLLTVEKMSTSTASTGGFNSV